MYAARKTRENVGEHSFFFQAEDGIRDYKVTGVQTCALPICIDISRCLILNPFKAPAVAGDCRSMDVSGNIDAILAKKGGEIYSIWPEATVFEAIEMMDQKNVGALLVMQANRLVGMISERDYTRKVFLRGKRSRETTVAEIMSTDLTIARPQEVVENCLRLMTEKHIRHLPVMDGEKVVGIISIGDLVKYVIASQSAAIAHLENYIHGGYTG